MSQTARPSAGRRPSGPAPRRRGFTLVEIMVAVAVIGVIAAIAVPSYLRYVTDARRTDATVFLIEAAGEQVRRRAETNRYADDLTGLGYPNATMLTPAGHYRVSVVPASTTASTFELVAEPVAGGPQAGDAACPDLRINSTGRRWSSSGSGECW